MKVLVHIIKTYTAEPKDFDDPEDNDELIVRVMERDGSLEKQLETITEDNTSAIMDIFDDEGILVANFKI